ncbi:hypothetical protein BEP19_04715 [Ammoniphilus oxalaticus]|uniref:Uncharacterized protein n=1 Tax=Ammoniphilus oxalaticus TaxID=66863 RepID=A0A419SMC6_9BACL|nr:hypothetical protein [Ammoniphilus oxalaticus]RKD25124.1 hypothetical protein BEP19_04715 [Ammoniphilus oxalaticus]
MSVRIRFNHEQLEALVLAHLRSQYPQFNLRDAILESSTGVGDEVRSWWIACEHQDGNESIIEDEQILLLIQEDKGWQKIKEHRVSVTEREGFILEVVGLDS